MLGLWLPERTGEQLLPPRTTTTNTGRRIR